MVWEIYGRRKSREEIRGEDKQGERRNWTCRTKNRRTIWSNTVMHIFRRPPIWSLSPKVISLCNRKSTKWEHDMELADKKKSPEYSTDEFQMESNIQPGESLLKWAKFKFIVFSWSLNHQILSNYNLSLLQATSHTNTVCCILPCSLNLGGLAEEFKYIRTRLYRWHIGLYNFWGNFKIILRN